MLAPFADDIWLASGPVAVVAGFRYPTRMAVIRLGDGGLFIWSPTALTPQMQAGVEALGEVRFLIAPNALHHLHLSDWRAAYPQAQLYAPPGLRKKRSDLRFDADLTDAAPPQWAQDIDQVMVRGNLITTEVVFFHRKSRTTIFTDLIQQISPDAHTGFHALIARLDAMSGPEPQVPHKFRNTTLNRRAARAAVRRILDWPTERVIMAHAPSIENDGQSFLKRAFRWLGV